MITINPLIIISEENSLKEQLDKIYTAFSTYEISPQINNEVVGRNFVIAKDKWWTFLNRPSVVINHENIPVLRNVDGIFNIDSYVFLIYKSFSDDFSQDDVANFIISNCQMFDNMIEIGSPREIYFLLYFPKNNPQLFQDIENNPNITCKIIFLTDTNCCDENLNGYRTLNIEEQLSQVCQIMFFLGIPEHASNLRNRLDSTQNCLKAASLGLSFERETILKNHANMLAYKTLYDFSKSKDWVNSVEVNNTDSLLGGNQIKDVYNRIKFNHLDIKKDLKRLLLKAPVSAWHLIHALLIQIYYESHIKNLPSRIAKNGQTLGNIIINSLESIFTDNRKKEEESFKKTILEKLGDDFKFSTKSGLEHYKRKISNYREKLTEIQKDCDITTDEIKKIFIESPPVFPLPHVIKTHCKDFATNIEQKPDDPINKEKGRDLLKTLKKKLEFHPIALSLMVRALIMGVLLMVIGMVILLHFPNFIMNISFFKKEEMRSFTMFLLFSAPLIITFLYFWLGIMNSIRSSQRKYLAWIVHTVQLVLFNKALSEMRKYYQSCINYCNELIDRINKIQSIFPDKENRENVFDDTPFLYPNSCFFEVPSSERININWNLGEFTEINCYQQFKKESDNFILDWFKEIITDTNDDKIKEKLQKLLLQQFIFCHLQTNLDLASYFSENWLFKNRLKPPLVGKLYPSYTYIAGTPLLNELKCIPGQTINDNNIGSYSTFLIFFNYFHN